MLDVERLAESRHARIESPDGPSLMGDGNPVEIGLPGREIAVGEIRKRHVETDLIQRNPRTGFTVTLGAADFVQAFTGRGKLRAVHGERRKQHEQNGAAGHETHENADHGITPTDSRSTTATGAAMTRAARLSPKVFAAVAQLGTLDVWTSQPM